MRPHSGSTRPRGRLLVAAALALTRHGLGHVARTVVGLGLEIAAGRIAIRRGQRWAGALALNSDQGGIDAVDDDEDAEGGMGAPEQCVSNPDPCPHGQPKETVIWSRPRVMDLALCGAVAVLLAACGGSAAKSSGSGSSTLAPASSAPTPSPAPIPSPTPVTSIVHCTDLRSEE